MKKIITLLLTVFLLLGLTACGGDDQGEDGTIKIGMIGPLEGDYSVYGTAVRNGADLAIKDYNEAHGTNYTLVAYDSKGDNTEAVNAYNKLVDEDEVLAIIGGTMSGESIAIASASQSLQTPIISPSATAANFTSIGSNIFRGCYTDPYQAKILAEFAYNTLGARTAAILYEQTDYSQGITKTFTEVFESMGGKVTNSEGYSTGDVNFNTQLTKIAASDPDVLVLPNYYKDDGLISKQAKALGIESTIIGGDGWDGVLTTVEDPKDIEGAIFVNHYNPDDQKIIELSNRYKETYNVDINAFSILSYDTTTCLLQVIDQSGQDQAKIIENLANVQFDGVLGHMEFDENGDPIKDMSYVTIKDGKYAAYGE